MNLGLWIALAALAVAIVGVGATIFATRRWGNRRRRILFAWEAAPLLLIGGDRDLLQVTYRDIPVEDPHLVTVRVANIGPSDIASRHFDADRPLVIRLNCTMYGLTRNSHPKDTISEAAGAEGIIQLRPLLLRRGEEWVFEAVVKGEPSPLMVSPIIDADIIEGPSAAKQLVELLADVAVSITLPWGGQIQLKR